MLLEFYGKECGHCKKMEPLIDQLEKELGVKVHKMEVWHDESNEKKWEDTELKEWASNYSKGIFAKMPFE